MASRRLFTQNEFWLGSFYELALELGERSDERLESAAVALWSDPRLDGPYGDRTREPGEQAKVSPSPIVSDDLVTHLYGVATLPDGNQVACGCVAVREDESRIDWLDLYIPMAALETVYDVDWQAHVSGEFETWRVWAAPLDDWFADIGRTVHRAVSFRLGLVGEEVSGMLSASDVAAEGIPDQRHLPILLPAEDGSLTWYPATEW